MKSGTKVRIIESPVSPRLVGLDGYVSQRQGSWALVTLGEPVVYKSGDSELKSQQTRYWLRLGWLEAIE